MPCFWSQIPNIPCYCFYRGTVENRNTIKIFTKIFIMCKKKDDYSFIFCIYRKNISEATVLIQTNVTNWYLDTISLSLSIGIYDWSNKSAWIWTHLQCERYGLAPITDCHSLKYIRSLRRPFSSTLIFQGHLEEPQRVPFSLALHTLPLSIYGWDLEMQDVFLDMCFHT